jgi:uncharacterized protein
MRTILITGGTGLVGKALVKQLVEKNYAVIILTRKLTDTPYQKNVSFALWNVKEGIIDMEAVKKADAIIHLAGAGVMDKKWDDTYKKEIEESRTQSSALLINTLQKIDHKVKVILSASAIGWYGEDKIPNHYFTENENADEAFLGMVCKKWEQSVEAAEALGIRVCKLRTGIVLTDDGGAYKEFKAPLKFGVASILGNGKQMVSWIHIDDLCRQFIFALENENIRGSYNAVAPMPVSNKTLTLEIAKNVKGKFYIPIHVPTFVLKIMMGDRSIEILKSATVSCEKIKAAGFTFLYPSIEAAVKAIEKKKMFLDKISG